TAFGLDREHGESSARALFYRTVKNSLKNVYLSDNNQRTHRAAIVFFIAALLYYTESFLAVIITI
ncbi:hypothetical protein ACG9XN_17905, partial [Acinetobacter baumannii]|uniref:hypothetical protein n=1 Tax=Acinetobacter baumannii TaxID=470 RepID=UPI003AF6287F